MEEVHEVEILPPPIQSEGDKKEYRLIKLSNGLKALLIKKNFDEQSSEHEENAAAALEVRVGSFDDPPQAQGLAHFLEHILFMGSQKYPSAQALNELLVANGGTTNARTTSENTAFFFHVSKKSFADALDIFAQQFVSPLLLRDAMQREREAVDSEYQMSLSNDYRRIWQIYNQLIDDAHPASQFGSGNLKTLRDDITDDDLHNELLKMFDKYVAEKMCLSIQSSRRLDDMQALVVKCFSDLKTRRGNDAEDNRKQIPKVEDIFKPEFFNKMHYLKPKHASKSLHFTWALPSVFKHYKCSPVNYIEQIFNNEGEGGIGSYLKEKQLITNISFETSLDKFISNSQFCIPSVAMSLTDLGSHHIGKILQAMFSYLLMIKNTPIEEHRRLFMDLKEKKEVDFKFYREAEALVNVRRHLSSLMIFDEEDVLRPDSSFLNFDEEVILDFIEKMNERSFHLIILDNDHQTYTKRTRFCLGEYDELDFPDEYLTLWNEREVNEEFFLPKPNPFKTTNFEIFEDEQESTVSWI